MSAAGHPPCFSGSLGASGEKNRLTRKPEKSGL